MQEEILITADDQSRDGRDSLAICGQGLQQTIKELTQQRKTIEARWVEDLQQYKGIYPTGTKFPDGGSQVFVNITREKTDNGEAQLVDMLFPSDDKNYGISPTPDPELANAVDNKEQVVNHEGQPMQFADDKTPFTEGDKATAMMEQAEEAAQNMEREIDDQLVECDYNAQARKAIHYAALLGTGVLCGPEVEMREQTAWAKDPQTGKYTAVYTQDKRPIVRHVPTWDFFPSMAASRVGECNELFERSYMSKKVLRDMRRIPGIIKENLRILLEETDPKSTQNYSEHVSKLREMSGIISMIDDKRYEVWRYRGPIERDVLISAGVISPDDTEAKKEYDGIIIFCGTQILKAAINPMETEVWPYSVFCWNYDDNCIFGTGIPYATRQPQAVINTSWRLLLDNATRSAGPQIVLDKRLTPADGVYAVTPWKFWEKKDPSLKLDDAFKIFDFKSYQTELANIYTLAKAQMDEESGVPAIQQGQQGQVTQTLGGMSMLMNASSAHRRNQVKHWDDDVTVPIIKRFYDWNMQFNPDDSIKGDLQVYARGTSALLMKEQQAQTLVNMLDKYGGHPVFSKFFKTQGLDAFRKAVQALHVSPDEILKTKEQYESELKQEQDAAQQQQEQGQQEDPRVTAEKLRSQNRMAETEKENEMHREDNQVQHDIAIIRRDTEIAKLSGHERIQYEAMAAKERDNDKSRDLDMSKFKTEVQIKQAEGIDANRGLGGDQ
jgi:hypothetical protein